MNTGNNDILDAAERYVQGNMSGKEKTDFENRMNSESAIFELVEKQRAIHHLMIEAGLNDIRQLLKNDLSTNTVKNTANGKWIGGAVIVAIVATGLYFVSQHKKNELLTNNDQFGVSKEHIITNIANDTQVVAIATETPVLSTSILDVTVEKKSPIALIDVPTIYTDSENKKEENSSSKKVVVSTNSTTNLEHSNQLESAKHKGTTNTNEPKIIVTEEVQEIKMNCINLEKETFNPSSEDAYVFSFDSKESAEIILYDKKMQEIRFFKIGELKEWDGRNKEGQLVETGLYKIEVRYSNGKRCLFNLTVFN